MWFTEEGSLMNGQIECLVTYEGGVEVQAVSCWEGEREEWYM